MAEIFVDSLFDAVLDCLKVIPILFLAYLLVSFLSHDHSHKFSRFLFKQNKAGVLYASLLGCVPQCGFSSVVADLFSARKVTLGTLVAVFVATSDEAIPIMISRAESIVPMLILICIKVLLAIVWGYCIDLCLGLFSKKKKSAAALQKHLHESEETANTHQQTHCHAEKNKNCVENLADECHQAVEKQACQHQHTTCKNEKTCQLQEEDGHSFETHHHCGHIHTQECQEDCGHTHGSCCGNNIFVDAFNHTFSIVVYIFVFTFLLNFVIAVFQANGVEILQNLFTQNPYLQVLVASLVGLIPNCASSVLLVELFSVGALGFAALLAGLTSGAGVGLLILWAKNKKHPLQNLAIMLLQFAIGAISGLLVCLIIK